MSSGPDTIPAAAADGIAAFKFNRFINMSTATDFNGNLRISVYCYINVFISAFIEVTRTAFAVVSIGFGSDPFGRIQFQPDCRILRSRTIAVIIFGNIA